MGFKKSIYNFEYSRNDYEHVIYNTFSKALVVLDQDEYVQYSAKDLVPQKLKTVML